MQLDLMNYSQTKKEVLLEEPEEIKSEVINKFKYGQYFTKTRIVEKVLNLILELKKYPPNISILEPSFGTGNFLKVLSEHKFTNITGCEIDSTLTNNPIDFFNFPIDNKFDLIIGNPPFTKYNVFESYYFPKDYANAKIKPQEYISQKLCRKDKHKIENIFILKTLKHLNDSNSTLAFVLPISFFIKNRNSEVKEELLKHFSTIIIYQDNKVWFDYDIPCCFAIFTNNEEYKDKILINYDNGKDNLKVFDISMYNEELIPEVVYNKEHKISNNVDGTPLSKYLAEKPARYTKSFTEHNMSAKNILERSKIPDGELVSDYKLAVVRVGNSSVGKCGLIKINKDIMNDMFYILDFREEYNNDKEIKEKICAIINKNQNYFKEVTCRVGSKSIKKEDIFNFKVEQDYIEGDKR